VAGADSSAPAFLRNEEKMSRLIPFTTLLLLMGILDCAADGTVELNGIACFFREKFAFFVILQPGQPASSGFTLAEGESQFGLKLLAVDAAAGRVEIEDHGGKKSLRLSSASNLGSSPAAGTAGGAETSSERGANGSAGGSDNNGLADQYQIMAGNPGWGTIPPVSNTSKSDGNSAARQNGGNANGADPVSALKDHASEGWYQESLSIEQSRAATAKEVLAGEMTPWPRTPLTPPGTPANLVGKETFFSSHIPGYVVPGFLNE